MKHFRKNILWALVALLALSACHSPARLPQGTPTSTVTAAPLLRTAPSSVPTKPLPSASASVSPLAPTLLAPTEAPVGTFTQVPSATFVPITTLLFTGIIVPGRCVQAAIDANGNPDYPYEEVRDVIQSTDLAVGTLNAALSDYSPHTGCVPTYVLVGSGNNADALQRAGFDIMSVATNHIKNCALTNCGERAFFDTLENLRRVGVLAVGAGADHAEAMQPVVATVNGVRFGFVSLGQIEPRAFAGPDTPGIAVLNSENLRQALAAARQAADVVIALPHWGPEDAARPTWIQRNLAQELAAAGADLVVGNHTHVVQGVQQVGGTPVFYGLGNFVFDQGLRDHRQGVILLVRFQGTQYLDQRFIPTHVDADGRVHLADPEEAAEILERIEVNSLPALAAP
jgi:poly-gamma-glutamate synthesis protein (capsule biosynthesis protein)